jgi:uncharacterized phiE125 gp8 family phage protein
MGRAPLAPIFALMIPNQMEYSTRHISGPTSEPVTLGEIYAALGVDEANTAINAEDLVKKAKAARREAEGVLGLKVGLQVWDIVLDYWPCWNWRIPLEPVQSIDGLFYTDVDGDEVEFDADSYVFSAASNRLWLKQGNLVAQCCARGFCRGAHPG